MNVGFRLGCLTGVAIALASASAGAATVLSGTFTGTSTGTQIFQGPGDNFDGTPASGSFRIDLTGCTDYAYLDPAIGPNCGGGSGPFEHPTTFLTLNTAEGTAKFRVPEYLAQLTNTATSQTLTVNFAFMDPYSSAYLNIVGPVDAFIHGVDFSEIHPGKINLGASSLDYQLGRSYRGSVTFTSLQFTDVPEPSSWTALATMTGVVAAGLRARKKAAA